MQVATNPATCLALAVTAQKQLRWMTEKQQSSDTSGGHLEQSETAQRPQRTSLMSLTFSFNPDASPFVTNPRQPAFSDLAEPFNSQSSTTGSNAPRPPFDVSHRPEPLGANYEPFSPWVTVPVVDPNPSMYSFDQPIITYSWDDAGSDSHAYVQSDAVGSSSMLPVCQLTHGTDVHTDAATRGMHF